MLSVGSIESCVVCDEYRNFVLSEAIIEIFVVCGKYTILCCLSQI